MGYQPKVKSPKGAIHVYKKPLREKRKDRKRVQRGIAEPIMAEKHSTTEREISELTLKQLHTLGSQKFGSSPFSEHFNRWLTNVTTVLDEFKSHTNIGADDQFSKECTHTLSKIKQQLERIFLKETALDQELNDLSDWRSHLRQINKEYATLTGSIKGQRNREIKHLYSVINLMQTEQDEVIRMKTGFFHGISKKNRERKESEVVNELNDKQTELELKMLDFSVKQKELRAEYDRKREPVLEEIKKFRRIIQTLETDSSLEDRWFACEALIDSINSFLQRKSAHSSGESN